jgi:regulator of sigma E protease
VRIYEVAPGSPAAEAGLAPGDLVVTANGVELASVDDLCRCMVFNQDKAIELTVLRSGAVSRLEAKPSLRRRAA